jgi:uncharacterized protein (DUF849 family)
VRVGLEDNLYLDKGVLATNAQLVERARAIVELLGVRVLSSQETRGRLGLSGAQVPQKVCSTRSPGSGGAA